MILMYVISGISAYIAMGFLCTMFYVRHRMLNPNDADDVAVIPLVVCLWPVFLPIGFFYVSGTKFLEYLKDMKDRYD